jgi:hypothetical protein
MAAAYRVATARASCCACLEWQWCCASDRRLAAWSALAQSLYRQLPFLWATLSRASWLVAFAGCRDHRTDASRWLASMVVAASALVLTLARPSLLPSRLCLLLLSSPSVLLLLLLVLTQPLVLLVGGHRLLLPVAFDPACLPVSLVSPVWSDWLTTLESLCPTNPKHNSIQADLDILRAATNRITSINVLSHHNKI